MQMKAQAISGGQFRVFYALVMVFVALTFTAGGATPPQTNTLYNFPGGPGGANPEGGVILGTNNSLFGTTFAGGAGWGTVFELTPPSAPGGNWTPSVLYTFVGSGGDGANPQGSLVTNSTGILYGTTSNGGANDLGAVYQL